MKRVHYIAHTHWDREWHKTFEAFRVRLEFTMRSVLQLLETDETFTAFHLDAQTSVVEDYLELYPEDRPRIARLVRGKRLFVGPWYTQPDLYLISGESWTRNLLLGSRIAEDLGHCMNLLYIPDSFGQAAQTPLMAREFDLQGAIVWRGVSASQLTQAFFRWRGSDDTEIRAVHLPIGYGANRYLPEDPHEAVQKVDDLFANLATFYTGSHVLMMGGSDHAMPQRNLPTLLRHTQDVWHQAGKQQRISLSTLEAFFQCTKDIPLTDTLYGEQRATRESRVHFGDASSRADIKIQNRILERRLATILEPMLSIAYAHGGEYPSGSVNRAWKCLLENQAHDSICSCCTDESHADIQMRFRYAEQIIRELHILFFRYMRTRLQTSTLQGHAVMVVNTLPHPRPGWVDVTVYANQAFRILDPNGHNVPYQICAERPADLVKENIAFAMDVAGANYVLERYEESDAYRFTEYQVLLDAKDLPSMGYTVLDVVSGEPMAVAPVLQVDDRRIENAFYIAQFAEDGTLCVQDKQTGLSYTDLLTLVDTGDDGDSYNFSPPREDVVVSTQGQKAEIKLLYQNAWAVSFQVSHELRIPSHVVNSVRVSASLDTLHVELTVRFRSDTARIEVQGAIQNQSRDHMLRLHFPLPFACEESVAEDHFSTIHRPNHIPGSERWEQEKLKEQPIPMYPMQGYVALESTAGSFLALSRGISEYEVLDNRTLALTLFRAVGWMGKPHLLARPGRVSGIEFATPDSQMRGLLCFECAFALSGKDWQQASQIADYLTPVTHSQFIEGNFAGDSEALSQSWVHLEGDGLHFSTMKRAEQGHALVIRVFNPTQADVTNAKLRLLMPHTQVWLSSLRERRQSLLESGNDVYALPRVGKASVLTLEVVLDAVSNDAR